MNTDEKSTAILKKLVEVCNKEPDIAPDGFPLDPTRPIITIGPDWGGNALTIAIGDAHTHVGDSAGTFENLVDRLYALLCEGKGLSWEKAGSSEEDCGPVASRDSLEAALDTALRGLGCRDPEDDKERCRAIQQTAALFGFQEIVDRAKRWLKS